MSQEYRLCVIPGDGIGPEVIPVAMEVLYATLPGLKVTQVQAGWATFQSTGVALPQESIEVARDCGAVLFGAVASPSHPVEGYRSPIVALRRELDVFANLRPSRGWPVAGARPGLDVLVVRENTEGLYSGRERLEGDTAITERVITRAGTKRVAETAYRLATLTGRKVTIVHKANVIRVGDGLWRETCLDVAQVYAHVETDEGLVDSVAYQLVRQPERYQILLTPNLYGDILSDLLAGMAGGLGLAPSISLGAARDDVDRVNAIAEPVHGAAPDIASRGIANPLGAILSAALLVRHAWQRPDVAQRIERAVELALDQGLRTPDIAGEGDPVVGTLEMGKAVLANLTSPSPDLA